MSVPAVTPSQGAVPAPSSFWRIVLASLKGESFDYTAESLNRSLLLLAVPMVLEMIMESLFAVVDIFWVSRLGSDAIAVVGITESVMTLIYAVAIGVSIAATAIVSRRIGERDLASARQAAGQILLIGIAFAVVLGVVFALLAGRILELMGADAAIVALGTDFARLMLGGNITVFLIFLINAIFRGAGDPALAMRTLWLANAINIVLAPFFIFGWGPFPELGVTGAAVATNLGRGIGVLYQLWHLTRGRSRVRIQWQHLRPVLADLRAIMTTAASGIGQLLITTTSWVGLFKILAASGSAALAGYTIAIRIVVFALLPASGLANAGSTLVGQNLGANQPDRAAQAIRVAALYNVIFLALFGVAFIVLARPLVGLFTSEPEVLRYGTQALWIVSLAFPMYAAGMCFEAAFNGAGDTWTPTWLNFFCLWLGQIPLAWLLAYPLGLGPYGVFIAVPISFSVLTVWTAVLFRRGRWKTMRI